MSIIAPCHSLMGLNDDTLAQQEDEIGDIDLHPGSACLLPA
jgi:hypothetical protein